jgi:hypothetical protein
MMPSTCSIQSPLQARRCTARLVSLRPASRDLIRYRAVRQRQSDVPSEIFSLTHERLLRAYAPRGRQTIGDGLPAYQTQGQQLNIQSDKLPSYLQSLHHIRPARPSMVSQELGSDASGQVPKHLEASRSIFSSQCMQNRHPSIRTMQTFTSSKDIRQTTRQNGGAERDRTADPLLAKQVLSQLSYSPIFQERQ